jgi:hypothetical protein
MAGAIRTASNGSVTSLLAEAARGEIQKIKPKHRRNSFFVIVVVDLTSGTIPNPQLQRYMTRRCES